VKHPYLPNFIIQELNRNEDFILNIKNSPGFPNLEKFKNQVAIEVEKGILRPISGEQLFINVLSLSVFPFIGRPLIKALANINEHDYNEIIERRKTEISDFIINAIKQ
jgi:hypothetical protein